MNHPLTRLAYRACIRLLSGGLRDTHAGEMERLLVETLELEIRRRGRIAYVLVLWGAFRDLAGWWNTTRRESRRIARGGDTQNRVVRRRLEGLFVDTVLSLRTLRSSRGFSALVILTLALGLGGSIAIFSVVDAVLLRPLPFPEPSNLYTVWETNLERGRTRSRVSPPTFVDWRQMAESFVEMSVLSEGAPTMSGGEAPQRIDAIYASPNVFSLLRVPMHVGGPFPQETGMKDGGRWAVLSFGFWERTFGGSPDAAGQTIVLDDEPHTIVGILPPDFRFPRTADVWLPLTFTPSQLSDGMRGARYLEVVARARSGVTIERAQAEMTALAASLAETHANNQGWGVSVVGLHDSMVSEFRRSLTLLMFATVLVLAIACVNVVNLVLVRGTDRRQEIAVRRALGASKWRLLRQSLVQHVSLAVLGGCVGMLAASWAVPPLIRLAPAEIPRIEDVAMDPRVVAFCATMSILVGVLLSVVSTWSGAGSHPAMTLRAQQVGGAPARQRMRRVLMVLEVALSLVLLIGAGLLIRSFIGLQRVDPGFSVSGIATVSLNLPDSRYPSGDQQLLLYREIIDRLERRSEVRSIGATTNLPLSGSAMRFGFAIDSRPDVTLSEQLSVEYHAVTPGYFRTMGIALRRGRSFLWTDDLNSTPAVIINETMARRYWAGDDPVGQRLTVLSQTGPISREIVGVVSDVRHSGLASEPRVEAYAPIAQDPWSFVTLVARARGGVDMAQLVRTELASIDARLPVGVVLPIERHVARWLAPLRFQAVLVALFAAAALALAALGIYGVISFAVSLRTNEIGVRLALGASRRRVFGSVMGQGLTMATAGAVVGVGLALVATRQMASLLFGVSPNDPLVFAAVPILILVVAAAACYVPARRAVSVDPVEALRDT